MVESSDPFPWADEKKNAKLGRKPFGENLAESLAAMLCYKAANRRYPDDGIYNHHRDYCGHGLMFFDEAFHLIEVQDGRPRESKILASWRDGAEFVAFWARQSDYSCSGADPDAGPLYSPQRSNRNNQRITRQRIEAFVTLVDHTKGMHSSDEPKTTAIALVTDQLDEWWDYIQTKDVAMRSDSYTPREGSAHDGFVAIDPEGYFLEFERFNPHPENERFMPVLDRTPTLYANPDSQVPEGLGFKATVIWFYYKDMVGIQRFYEDVLGFDMIVDQGWAKIYPVGPTGYFGLVDEQRGMHNFTEEKAVTMSFWTADIDGWYEYLSNHGGIEMRSPAIEEEEPYRAFVAYDPEGYFLEWDVFNPVPENEKLLEAVNAE